MHRMEDQCALCNKTIYTETPAFLCLYCCSALCYPCALEFHEEIEVCIMCGEGKHPGTETLSEPTTPIATIDSHPTVWNEIITNIPIKNLGNTCYINSAIQLMLHANLFGDLLDCFHVKKSATMKDLIKTLRAEYTTLQSIPLYDQCDSALFFKWLLDFMKDREKDSVEQFTFHIRNTFICNTCNHRSKSSMEDTMLTIYVTKPQCELLQCYQDSVLKNIVERSCEECKSCTTHTQKWNVHNNLLAFFHIVYADELCSLQDITTIISFHEANKEQVYHLQAFIVHRKPYSFVDENVGHYVCYCKEENNEWIEYNDDTCNVIETNSILCILQNIQLSSLYYARPVCLAYTFEEEIEEEA